MREIVLNQGKVAIVDDADYDWMRQYKWYCHSRGYATRHACTPDGRQTMEFMHRAVLGTAKGECCDHINHNKLDNRRENLRICTAAQNQHNQRRRKNNTSGYKGVDWNKESGKWRATIKLNYRKIHIGRFTDQREAAIAYNEAAVRLFGEFALLNVIDEQKKEDTP